MCYENRDHSGGNGLGEAAGFGGSSLAGMTSPRSSLSGRVFRAGLAIVLMLGVVVGSGFALPSGVAAEGIWVQVTTDVVNVRDTPNGVIIGQASWGQSFEVVGGPTPDNWYKIDYYGVHGFVLGDYLGAGGMDMAVGSDMAPVDDAVPVAAAPIVSERWVDVDRSSQLVTLYDGDVAVVQVWAAMSSDQSDGGFWATANGTYYVFAKEGALHYTAYGRAWIRDYVAFDPSRDNGFHSYSLESWGDYAHGYNAPTGGCVALDLWAAQYLFDFVSIGSRVEVHW